MTAVGLVYDALTMARYEGPKSGLFDGQTFYSASYEKKRPSDLLKWRFNREPGAWEHRTTQTQRPPERVSEGLRITLINHATLLIQTANLNLLTDPTWSGSTGPFGKIGPSRFRHPGVPFDALPPIDAVFVSHSHYDHMDLPTLARLDKTHAPLFIVGLGNAGNLAKVNIDNVIELDWWAETKVGDSLTLTMTPARHWSKRTALDTNRTLWGSFVLHDDARPLVFFAGDTGLGNHFRLIRQRLGEVPVALMPIGAYLPRWFMKDNHLSPSDALTATSDLGSDVMIPIHYGTFALGDDGQDLPLTTLRDEHSRLALLGDESIPTLQVLDNGESVRIDAHTR